jgi:hypothetical protein
MTLPREGATVHLRNRLVTFGVAGSLACLGAGLAPVGHVHAATICDDGGGNEWKEVNLMGPLGSLAPISLAAEIGDGGSPANLHVGLCYGTNSEAQNAAGQPELAGGYTIVDVLNPTSNDGAPTAVGMGWDPNSTLQFNWRAGTAPTYTVTPGAVGDTISISIPIGICLAGCNTTPVGVGPTGVLVYQLTPQPEPGIGLGYTLTGVQVAVDGITLVNQNVGPTGAYVNPFVSVLKSLDPTQGGPCVAGVCVPKGYVETSAPVAGIQLLGLTVDVPKCLYSNPSGQCP